jgi:hypothetical protein
VLALVNPLAGKLANCVKTCHFQVGVVCIQLAIRYSLRAYLCCRLRSAPCRCGTALVSTRWWWRNPPFVLRICP